MFSDSSDWCPYKKRREQRDTQKMPREDRGKDWNYTATSQGVWRPLDVGRNKEAFFSRVFRGTLPTYMDF